MNVSVVVPGLVRRWLLLLIGVVSIAVVLATLGRAPLAQAAPIEEPVAVSDEAQEEVGVEPQSDDDWDICVLDGGFAEGDWDCVTFSVAAGAASPKGGKVRLKGKIRLDDLPGSRGPSTRGDDVGPGQVVIIERAKDGTRWTDEGQRWKRVATVVADEDGRFAKSVKMRKRGLYTFRARVQVASGVQTVRTDSSATSDSVTATAGAPGYGYLIKNDSKHDLRLRCLWQADGKDAVAGDLMDFVEKDSVGCVTYGLEQTSGGFLLQQKNPIIGDPSVYNFVGQSNDGNACKDMVSPKVGDKDIIEVSIKDAGFWGLGYTGTMTYPDGSSCNFRMLTDTQKHLAEQPTWAKVVEIVVGVVLVCVVIAAALYLGGVLAGGGAAAGSGSFAGATGGSFASTATSVLDASSFGSSVFGEVSSAGGSIAWAGESFGPAEVVFTVL